MYPVLGASLLSAAASLPLHLMPFLVVVLVGESRLAVEQAGWIASAYMAGQLAASVLLPTLGMTRLRLAPAAGAALLLAAGPGLSQLARGTAEIVSTWFAVGVACGALQFLGATTAAAARNKPAAFALRLGAILVASALAIALLGLRSGFSGYGVLAGQMGAMLAVLVLAGMALYRVPAGGPARAVRPHAPSSPAHWWGLAAVLLVFAGQPGFWAYAVQGAQQRGIDVGEVALAVAASKLLSALWLLAAIRRPACLQEGLLAPGLAVAAGIALMAGATALPVFVTGLLMWELAVNLLSVRFQAALVHTAGPAAGAWLTGAIFLGAAIGPFAHGLALRAGVQGAFIAFACLSGLIPFLWSLHRQPRWVAEGA